MFSLCHCDSNHSRPENRTPTNTNVTCTNPDKTGIEMLIDFANFKPIFTRPKTLSAPPSPDRTITTMHNLPDEIKPITPFTEKVFKKIILEIE